MPARRRLPALLLAVVLPSRAVMAQPVDPSTSLTRWFEGVASSAAALARDDPAAAEVAARDALSSIPRGPAGARAELALGLALRDQGRLEDATSSLGRAERDLPVGALRDAASFEHAQILFYGGQPSRAAAAFAQLAAHAPAALARRARWRTADALLAAGTPVEAAAAYQQLLADEPTSSLAPTGRLSLAQALAGAGDVARAGAVYRALWIDQPEERAGRSAARALRAMRQAGQVPPPTAYERLARAARLLELAAPRRVLEVLDRLDQAGPPPDAARRSRLLRALALVQLGRREEASALARALETDPGSEPGIRTGAELVLARVAARARRLDEAAGRYARIAATGSDVPGLPPAQARGLREEAAFLAAWLVYDSGAYARALEALRSYLRDRPRARRADDARWFEAWSLLRLGRREEARKAMARLARGPLGAAALYWQARLATRREEERTLLRRVVKQAPQTWYALLAAGWLEKHGERPPQLVAANPAAIPDGPGAGAPGEGLVRAADLLGAGLRGEAVGELRAIASARDVRRVADRLAQLAEAAGDAELPFRMARDHLAPSRRALRWLYPRAFPELLPAAARQAGVDPSLYLAIMRRESGFRPDARSGAGAVGLVQLIPPTAERVRVVHGLSWESQRLDRPEVCVPLGAAYLGLLSDRFGDPAVVLAAYNAGPASAEAWARAGTGHPLEAWAEEVPYRETRRYVKNVTADAVVYRALWEGGELAVDPARPIAAPREGVGF